jgi:hypothetical protein
LGHVVVPLYLFASCAVCGLSPSGVFHMGKTTG